MTTFIITTSFPSSGEPLPAGQVSDLRVTTFDLSAGAADVTITQQPTNGYAMVRPDKKVALVLTEGAASLGVDSFDVSVGGVSQTLSYEILASIQEAGWCLGDHYMLPVDTNNRVVVTPGVNHRKVYISGSAGALSRADIAALEGIPEATITRAWVVANPQYGGSEALALAPDVGIDLWYDLTWEKTSSHWLLLEKGHTYNLRGSLIALGSDGESPLHPMHITSWGAGARPEITSSVRAFQQTSENFVITDVTLAGGFATYDNSNNILLEGVRFYEGDLVAGAISNITVRNSEFSNITMQAPSNGTYWQSSDYSQGVFIDQASGILFENNFFNHNGWAEGYDGTVAGGQMPVQYSHNIYLQDTTRDVTFRDNISSQAAAWGVHLRGGAFAEGNAFIDNNAHVSILGGDYRGAGPVGNFTLFMDNIITSSGSKKAPIPVGSPATSWPTGANDWGWVNRARDTNFTNNIIAHEANPNDLAEIAFKVDGGDDDPAANSNGGNVGDLPEYEPIFDDTIIYNWNGFEQNLTGLIPSELDQITIQNFAIDFLNIAQGSEPANTNMTYYYKSGLLYAILDYADTNWQAGTLTAKQIVDFFQAGFGTPRPTGATVHRFQPDDKSDGVRWDNRLNWDTLQEPVTGHTAYLGGARVRCSTRTVNGTIYLEGGTLTIGGGLFSGSIIGPGTVVLERAGQCNAVLSAGATLVDNRL